MARHSQRFVHRLYSTATIKPRISSITQLTSQMERRLAAKFRINSATIRSDIDRLTAKIDHNMASILKQQFECKQEIIKYSNQFSTKWGWAKFGASVLTILVTSWSCTTRIFDHDAIKSKLVALKEETEQLASTPTIKRK